MQQVAAGMEEYMYVVDATAGRCLMEAWAGQMQTGTGGRHDQGPTSL